MRPHGVCSSRKRCSVILFDHRDEQVKIYVKGADNVIRERLTPESLATVGFPPTPTCRNFRRSVCALSSVCAYRVIPRAVRIQLGWIVCATSVHLRRSTDGRTEADGSAVCMLARRRVLAPVGERCARAHRTWVCQSACSPCCVSALLVHSSLPPPLVMSFLRASASAIRANTRLATIVPRAVSAAPTAASLQQQRRGQANSAKPKGQRSGNEQQRGGSEWRMCAAADTRAAAVMVVAFRQSVWSHCDCDRQHERHRSGHCALVPRCRRKRDAQRLRRCIRHSLVAIAAEAGVSRVLHRVLPG